MKKNILLYIHLNQTLGHYTLAVKMVEALLDSGHRVAVINSGQIRTWKGVNEILYLEGVAAAEGAFDNLQITGGLQKRKEKIKEFIKLCSWDYLLIDFFPFGRFRLKNEIVYLMRKLRNRNSKTIVASVMRDFLGKPSSKYKTTDKLLNNFDAILVFGDQSLGPFEIFNFKNRYLGYPSGLEIPKTNENKILLSCGGGTELREFLQRALPLVARFGSKYRSILYPGPHAKKIDIDLFSGEIKKAMKISEEDLNSSSIWILGAGHGSCSELLSYNGLGILIPRGGDLEQEKRARIFEMNRLALGEKLPAELSMENIQQLIDEQNINRKNIRRDGIERFIDWINLDFEARMNISEATEIVHH